MDNISCYKALHNDISVDMYSHYTNKSIEEWELIPYYSKKEHTFCTKFFFNDKKITVGNYNKESGKYDTRFLIKTDAIVYYLVSRTAMSMYKKHKIINGVTVKELIEKELIQPFLLFIDNKFVRWSKIILYRDLKDTYLIIDDNRYFKAYEPPEEVGDIPDDIDDNIGHTSEWYAENHTVTILNLPINKNILFYSEKKEHAEAPLEPGQEPPGPDNSPWTLIFGFDEYGVLNVDGRTRIYMYNVDTNIGYIQLRLPFVSISDNGKEIDKVIIEDDVQVPDECQLYPSNFIIFRNDILYSNPNIEISPYNTFTVDGGKTGWLEYKMFYDKASQKPYNNVSQIPNHEFLRHTYLNIKPNPEWMSILHKRFDFDLDTSKSFDENMEDFKSYLMSYNYRTLIDKIKSKRVVVYGGYIGHMDKVSRSRRLLMFPKEWESDTIGYMLFINGMLSNAFVLEETTYGVYVDFSLYSDNSYYEMVVMDNKGGNMVYTITNPDQTVYFPVREDECVYEYYCSESDKQIFTILDQMKDNVQYKIPSTDYIEDSNGTTILNDFYLQNKTIYRVPVDRISQDYMVVQEDEFFEWHLDPEKFKFCTDKDRYLVFVNGLRLSSELYRVIVPDPLTPFDDQAIYFNIWLNKGDSIHVCYTCLNTIDEVHIDRLSGSSSNKSGVDTLGYIVGPSDYPVPLSKDLQFYFVNGIKIPAAYLMDISYDMIRLTVNMKTIENLSIVGIDSELTDFFESLNLDKSYLDEVFQMNDKNTINIMTNAYTSITDTQKPRKKEIDDHAMINEIVRHYYGHVNKGIPFRYVYDSHVYAEVDRDGNIIIDVMDATKEVNLLPDEEDPIVKEDNDNGSE